MSPTAAKILNHCKAVVNLEIKDNCVDIYDSEDGYNLYPAWAHLFVSEASSPSDLQLAARILGLDRPAPAPVLTPDWTTPQDGIIHVPDHLDPLINKAGFQVKLHKISKRISEPEMVCRIVRAAEEFFLSPAPVVLEWKYREDGEEWSARFNSVISAFYTANDHGCTVCVTFYNRNIECKWFPTEAEARAWCADTITKIITPTK